MHLMPMCVSFIPTTGQPQSSITLTRISPSDIINGGVICPNFYPVEITCVGIEVYFLQWQRNGTNIGGSFTSASNNGQVQPEDLFTLILDSITTRIITNNIMVANMISRLIANISNVNSGDRIGCTATGVQDTITLNYTLRGNMYILNLTISYSK